MRDIKFRAWHKLSGKMVEPMDIFLIPKRPEGGQAMQGNGWDYELMQYTGLKDKNGKEIYEGDIVKIKDKFGEYLLVVEWRLDRWFLNWSYVKSVGKYDYSITDSDKYFEVIGNIYEHGYLLEQKDGVQQKS